MFDAFDRPPSTIGELVAALGLEMAEAAARWDRAQQKVRVQRGFATYEWDGYHERPIDTVADLRQARLASYWLRYPRGRAGGERALRQVFGAPEEVAGRRRYGPFYVTAADGDELVLEWYRREPEWAAATADLALRERTMAGLADRIRHAAHLYDARSVLVGLQLWLRPPVRATELAAALGFPDVVARTVDVHMSSYALGSVRGDRVQPLRIGRFDARVNLAGRPSGEVVDSVRVLAGIVRKVGPEDEVSGLTIEPSYPEPAAAQTTSPAQLALARYLRVGPFPDGGEEIAAALGEQYPSEADLVRRYAGDARNPIECGAGPYAGRLVHVGPNPPAGAEPGALWLDSCEIALMQLLPFYVDPADREYLSAEARVRDARQACWFAVRPVARFQYGAFLDVAPVDPGRFDRDAALRGDPHEPVTGVSCAQAGAYLFWFGKFFAGGNQWLAACEAGLQAWSTLAREWEGAHDDEFDVVLSPQTLDVEYDDIASVTDPPMLYPHGSAPPNVTFRSAVPCVYGLSTGQVATGNGMIFGRLPRPDGRMKLEDVFVDRERRFSLDVDEVSGRTFVSIPVSNHRADYLEHYEVTTTAFERYRADPRLAHDFVDACKRREMDHLLLYKPGRWRGAP